MDEDSDLSDEIYLAVKDVEIIGFDVLEFALIIAGVVFILLLICVGVCCCARLTKGKKKRVI